MDLVRLIALILAGQRMLGIDARHPDIGISRGVGLDLLAARAAHQLVHRLVERPPGQIPQRIVNDAGDVLRNIRHPEPLPHHLAVARVLAPQQRQDAAADHLLVDDVEPLGIAMRAAAEIIAGDAFIGLDGQNGLHQIGLGHGQGVPHVPAVGIGAESLDPYVGDFHGLAPFSMPDGTDRRLTLSIAQSSGLRTTAAPTNSTCVRRTS